MTSRILIAYATKNGSTEEVAVAVGSALEKTGHVVVVKKIKEITSVDGYDAVVIGAPIYLGKVIEVKEFITRFGAILDKKPVTAFVIGIGPASPEAAKQEESRNALDVALHPLRPVSTALFGGVVNPDKLPFFQRKLTALAKAPVGDFRDWDAIASWAGSLSAVMGSG